MTTYRLNISSQDRLLGHFESSVPWAKDAIREVAAVLMKHSNYQLEWQVAYDEKRLLLSSPEGIQVLGRELLFQPTSDNCL